MPTQKFIDRPFVVPMLVLGGAVLAVGIIFSWAFYSARSSSGTLSVTGSAKQEVKADNGKWTVSVYRSAYQESLQGAYSGVEKDAAAVVAYFVAQGIAAENIAQNTTVADQDWSKSQNNGPTVYNVHREITVESADVDKIASLAQNVSALVNKGYSISPRQPEYYISTLPTLRVQLLGAAIADAKARAEAIAKSGGSSVGGLQSASSGVVQVLAPNSTNIEDYGSYDTSTIQKEVSVTARASFEVR